jgi:hypothetical protein
VDDQSKKQANYSVSLYSFPCNSRMDCCVVEKYTCSLIVCFVIVAYFIGLGCSLVADGNL